MRKKRLFWYIYPSFLLVVIAPILALAWYGWHILERSVRPTARERLTMAAEAVRGELPTSSSASDVETARQVGRAISRAFGVEISIVASGGDTLFDSRQEPPPPIERASQRNAIRMALAGEAGEATIYDPELGDQLLHVALPVEIGHAAGAVVASAQLGPAREQVAAAQTRLALGALTAVAVAAGVSFAAAKRISGPISDMRFGADRLAHGDFAQRLGSHDSDELTGLAEAINHMAYQLEERANTIGRQGYEQEAILASMVEGVLAVDSEEHVISLNRAAARLVDGNPAGLRGRRLQEVIRNPELRRFTMQALVSDEPIEDDLILRGDPDRVLRVRGTALRDVRGTGIGAVIVLNDITHFRHLENVRRDFVANVSHELKTPIASIKGFVETLLDGAMSNPADAERFLRIVVKQADRLNSIIEDLLNLSKIEQSEEALNLVLEDAPIRDVLEAVRGDCLAQAAQRNVDVWVTCDGSIRAAVNQPLLEQAVMNLLDNAIKYSEPGSEIHVTASETGSEVAIEVTDRGCGIEQEHLPRLFERFYRADKARSRKLGGTGLGLAIVKHIVQAHRGRITVVSVPGKGSTFTIFLTKSPAATMA